MANEHFSQPSEFDPDNRLCDDARAVLEILGEQKAGLFRGPQGQQLESPSSHYDRQPDAPVSHGEYADEAPDAIAVETNDTKKPIWPYVVGSVVVLAVAANLAGGNGDSSSVTNQQAEIPVAAASESPAPTQEPDESASSEDNASPSTSASPDESSAPAAKPEVSALAEGTIAGPEKVDEPQATKTHTVTNDGKYVRIITEAKNKKSGDVTRKTARIACDAKNSLATLDYGYVPGIAKNDSIKLTLAQQTLRNVSLCSKGQFSIDELTKKGVNGYQAEVWKIIGQLGEPNKLPANKKLA